MDALNTATWLDPGIVSSYEGDTELQPAEARIFDELRPRLAGWSMLDIGVGAGRTAFHLAPLAADYLGVDISPHFVESCRRQFGSQGRFEVADARNLSSMGEGRFDFVLFSFNGLDYLNHEERLKSLAEIRRVCKPGAVFCFSTHNTQALPHVMGFRAQFTRRHPLVLYRNLSNWTRWRLFHSREVSEARADKPDWAIVNDGAHDCGLMTYYVRPGYQLTQLQPAFGDVRVFSYGGEELTPARLDSVEDDWLYYLCVAR